MKPLLIQTENVRRADRVLARLKTKEKPGLVVIYGEPGYGKTYYSQNRTFSNGWCYYRIKANETAKSFLQEIYRRLNRIYAGSNETMVGSTIKLENACIEIFKRLPDTVFAIDEVNLLWQLRAKKWDIVETIRDFRDAADAQIIMIGENNTKAALEGYNPHYFGRCEFVPFSENQSNEVASIIKNCSEIELDKDVYVHIMGHLGGNLHQVRSFIEDCETTARERNLKIFTMKDFKL